MECSAQINDSFTIYVHDLFYITYTNAFTVDNLTSIIVAICHDWHILNFLLQHLS